MTTDDKPWMNRTPYQVYIEALWAAPEGYALVPIEPSDGMLDSGREAGDFHIMHYDGTDKPGTPLYSLRQSWAAMIAAAPTHKEINHG